MAQGQHCQGGECLANSLQGPEDGQQVLELRQVKPSCLLKQWSPTFLAPGTGFVEDARGCGWSSGELCQLAHCGWGR